MYTCPEKMEAGPKEIKEVLVKVLRSKRIVTRSEKDVTRKNKEQPSKKLEDFKFQLLTDVLVS